MKILYSLLIIIMRKKRIHEFCKIREMPNVQGSVIYLINHSCKYDYPYISEIIGKQSYVLVGKQSLEIIDRICFFLNGVIWVDRKNKKSRADAYYRIISLLKKKKQICIFPEGTWNLTDSQPMLPLYWGCIELAKETKSALVPIILEYKGDRSV